MLTLWGAGGPSEGRLGVGDTVTWDHGHKQVPNFPQLRHSGGGTHLIAVLLLRLKAFLLWHN